jgi:hypothetical protein
MNCQGSVYQLKGYKKNHEGPSVRVPVADCFASMLQILRRWQSTLSKNAIIVLNNGQHTLRAKKIGLTGFNRARAQSSENWIIWQKRRCHQINPLIRAKTESSQAGRPDVF